MPVRPSGSGDCPVQLAFFGDPVPFDELPSVHDSYDPAGRPRVPPPSR